MRHFGHLVCWLASATISDKQSPSPSQLVAASSQVQWAHADPAPRELTKRYCPILCSANHSTQAPPFSTQLSPRARPEALERASAGTYCCRHWAPFGRSWSVLLALVRDHFCMLIKRNACQLRFGAHAQTDVERPLNNGPEAPGKPPRRAGRPMVACQFAADRFGATNSGA